MPSRPTATKIVARLQKEGHIAYFAGGWVRDYLLKSPSDDIDIATSASVEEIQKLFSKTIPVGIAFGIIIVVEEGFHFEIATFRKEKEYTDGRRPSFIEKASAEEDAQRRDFTINGLFFDPIEEKLLDFVGGVEDLKQGVIKAIGDPHHRFLEDRLRMIRAIRYSTRFHFPIEFSTKQAILSHAKSLFPAVAIERVWQELQKMSRYRNFTNGLITLHELQLLQTIFPSLQDKPIPEIPTFADNCPLILRLLHLFPEDSLEKHLELTEYLKLSKKEKEEVRFFHKAKSLLEMPLLWQEKVENLEWAYFYANPLSAVLLDLFHLSHKEKIDILSPYIIRLQEKKPVIVADDLLKEGIPPGKTLGILLKEAEKISINTLTEDKQKILDTLKKGALWPK